MLVQASQPSNSFVSATEQMLQIGMPQIMHMYFFSFEQEEQCIMLHAILCFQMISQAKLLKSGASRQLVKFCACSASFIISSKLNFTTDNLCI